MPAPNVFSISPGRPFLEVLAKAILDGALPAPGGTRPELIDLPAMTILLPTRRAARALQSAFLKVAGGRAMLLPAIRPIAESDEEQGLIQSLATGVDRAALASALPPAAGKLERQLELTNLVLAWSRALRGAAAEADALAPLAPLATAGAGTPAQAAHLASELARLMDTVETENVSLDRLAALVPENLSEHWQQTLDFLRIATEFWPRRLAEQGRLSPMQRRNRLILAEAERLASSPPAAPVVIAGVTGSIPATAELMRAVVGLANGAIVLPGLDTGLDAPSWELIAEEQRSEHPQYGFRILLERLGIRREDVRELLPTGHAPRKAARNRLIGEALRPTGTMQRWRDFVADADRKVLEDALAGVSLIEAPSAEDEAETVALILREAAETPGRTAALVSPDRLLGRRVAVRLASWGIRVDDSAGRPFAKTMPGTLLDLVAGAFDADFAPAELMSLLKHPLARLGMAPGPLRRAARNLEVTAFRTTYLGSGLAGVALAVERAAHAATAREHPNRAARLMRTEDFAAVRDLLRRLGEAFAPLDRLAAAGGTGSLSAIAAAHAAVAEAIAAEPAPASEAGAAASTGASQSLLWRGEAGEVGWQIFESLADPATPDVPLTVAEYPEFYRALVANETVRPRVAVHPRLSIWGPFEARLQQPDILILGSLNEGTWPKAVDPGAWLNRPMRRELGLPTPEEEVGRAAHDLTTFLGADRVILTRADKVDGVPRVPSRWLLRLKALLGGLGLEQALASPTSWLAWARWRSHAAAFTPVEPPAPCPAVALRPRAASVSEIETWLANPYAIFAKRILGLAAMPPLGREPGPSEKGQVIHAALAEFTRLRPGALPADVVGEFMAAAGSVIGPFREEPRVRAFWLPRIERFAEWFAATEAARRVGVTGILTEVAGAQVIEAPAGPFKLSARADRIDLSPAGLVVTDYKTAALPGHKDVRAGAAAQLPLEAAIAIAGGFAGIPASPVRALRYIRATGAEPPGKELDVDPGGEDIAALAARVLAGIARLVADYDDAAMAYRAVRRPGFSYDYDDYAHLARVAEWSIDTSEPAQ